ncbi:MAG TPA: hypothetical protein VD833_24485 [Vicinamibacterales bacterium]|nr:hypothetical protein [Vicinamibacterales bacterium]
MPTIEAATVTAFYLFDVAEQIDLNRLRTVIGGEAVPARLTTKSAAPTHLQYSVPPVVVDGDALGVAELDGFRLRVKFFDYGVLSLALTRRFAGEWTELIGLSQTYMESAELESRAEAVARSVVSRCGTAMGGARAEILSEDYLVFAITAFAAPTNAEALVNGRAAEIALLLRGERQALSQQEQDDILRHRLSYLADDLVVPTWNAAFVYDTDVGAQAALEIFEFANSQLLEFRYYDERLDVELTRIYPQLQRQHWWETLVGRGQIRAAHQLHALFIEVNEITDRTQNALKLAGDIYTARLFNLAAARLGLAFWKASVEDKLETLDDIYRFAVEQVAISRGHFLELTIVLILLLELVLFFMGIMT